MAHLYCPECAQRLDAYLNLLGELNSLVQAQNVNSAAMIKDESLNRRLDLKTRKFQSVRKQLSLHVEGHDDN
jgi:hypothetical protein